MSKKKRLSTALKILASEALFNAQQIETITGIKPKSLYVGWREYQTIVGECCIEVGERPNIEGLSIYTVDAESHFSVGF